MATKQTKPKPKINPNAFQLLRKSLRGKMDRIQAIQTNAPNIISDEIMDRLIGAEHALLEATQQKNYLDTWITTAEASIVERHKEWRENCGCGVCRRKSA